MPTTPFTSGFVDKLKNSSSWRFQGEIGNEIFTPRFFCCTDPNELGLSPGKNPVAVISVIPNPSFVGEDISIDGSDSFDPDGAVVGYDWSFEGHTPGTGSSSTDTLNYASEGVYTIELIVEDGTGLFSSPARVELLVIDRNKINDVYIAMETIGVIYTGDGALNWTAKNNGVSDDDLTALDVIIDPATQILPEDSKTIWRSGYGTVYASNDGADNWYQIDNPTIPNDWGDTPAPSAVDMNFVKLHFVGERLFLLANYQNSSNDWRSYLWYTDNAGDVREDPENATVVWTQVTTGWHT